MPAARRANVPMQFMALGSVYIYLVILSWRAVLAAVASPSNSSATRIFFFFMLQLLALLG